MSYSILIVEDHEDARNFMVFYLHSLGFEVCEAVNGSEGVKTAVLCKPDLILMDISMPVMDGLQATKIIRESGDGISKTPIVAVTAFDDLMFDPSFGFARCYFSESDADFLLPYIAALILFLIEIESSL